MSEYDYETDLLPLLVGLTEGGLSDEQFARLREMVQSDAACRKAYLDHIAVHAMLEFRYGACDPQPQESESVLLDLLEMERAAPTKIPEAEASVNQSRGHRARARRGPTQRVNGCAGPENREQSRCLVITNSIIYGGIAAVLAIVIGLLLLDGDHSPGEPDPSGPTGADIAQHDLQWIARVSASDHPQWRGKQFAIGDRLIHGRYTLLRGSVQLDYQDGKKIVFEAPVSFSLDSSEAVSLHSGQLTGLCPTAESRGFRVVTPTATIVDLGTEFGVAVLENRDTVVEVFDGSVSMAVGDEPTDEDVQLAAGQTGKVGKEDVEVAIDLPLSTTFMRVGRVGVHAGYLYGVDVGTGEVRGAGTLLRLSPQTGEIQRIGRPKESFHDVQSMAYNPNAHELYGYRLNDDVLIAINPDNGDIIRTLPITGIPGEEVISFALGYDPRTDTLWAINNHSNGRNAHSSLMKIDTATGRATPVGNRFLIDEDNFVAMEFDPATNKIYTFGHVNTRFYTVDATTGELSRREIDGLGDFPFTNVLGLASDPGSGLLYCVTTQRECFTLNARTGQAVPLALNVKGHNVRGLAFIPSRDSTRRSGKETRP